MSAVRILIGDMPRMLRSLVESVLDDDPRFELVPEEAPVDVLLVSEGAMSDLLSHPAAWQTPAGVGVVAIAADGKSAAVVRLRAQRRSLDGDPRHMLTHAILSAAGASAEHH